MSDRTDRFIEALHTLEDRGDAAPIAALFAPDADVSNPLVKHDGEGRQGADEFWSMYRKAFETIHSEFRNIVDDGGVAMLEWVSEGSANGESVRYGGVSVLEHGADGIKAFRTYFDSRQVMPRPAA